MAAPLAGADDAPPGYSGAGGTKWEALIGGAKSIYGAPPVPNSHTSDPSYLWRTCMLKWTTHGAVKQHVELFEAVTGMETENKYSVFGPTRSALPLLCSRELRAAAAVTGLRWHDCCKFDLLLAANCRR